MSNHHLELYQYWRSSCSWRIRWALAYKGIQFQKHSINLLKNEQRSAAFLELNPSGAVPVLKVDDQAFSESLAILEWLEETYPDPPLLPNDSLQRMRVRQLALTIIAGIQPLQNLSALNYITQDAEEKKRHAQHWIARGFEVYEQLISSTAGEYSFGDQLTLADLCLIPQCYNAKRYEVDMSDFPLIAKIFERCMSRDDCRAAAPEQQPDAQA